MSSYRFRRIFSYIIDILFVSFLVAMFYQVKGINPNQNDYSKWQKEYLKYIEKPTEPNYSLDEISYNLTKYGKTYIVIDVFVYAGYFILFQKYNNGQTLGKRINKIKIETDDESLSFKPFVVRLLLLYNLVPQVISSLLVTFVSKNAYLVYYKYIILINNIFLLTVFILFLKNKETFYDKLTNSKVIDIKK